VSRGWLTLTGHVWEESQSAGAVEHAASITGVVGVTNQIKVTERAPRAGG
jgi:osmotically-inducible protein OsmY